MDDHPSAQTTDTTWVHKSATNNSLFEDYTHMDDQGHGY